MENVRGFMLCCLTSVRPLGDARARVSAGAFSLLWKEFVCKNIDLEISENFAVSGLAARREFVRFVLVFVGARGCR